MVKPNVASVSFQDVLAGLLCAVVAAWLVSVIYGSLSENYSTSRVWETWFEPGSLGARWEPIVVFALLTGAGIGIALSFAFGRHAWKVAAVAAVLQLLPAAVSGSTVPSIIVAAGLVLGALPARQPR